jgi:F-type H+-transporting ATPase subunit b
MMSFSTASEFEAQEYQTQRAVLEAQREAWLEQARQDIATRRTEGLEQARREVAAQREEWLAAWQRERLENQHALQQEAARRLTEAVRCALRDLADADLESRMLTPLWAKLRALEINERAVLAQAALGGCTVYTAFPLDAELRQQSQTALRECLGAEIPLIFRHDPNAACGVILEMPGHRLTWTLDSYLAGFEEALTQVLNAPAPETNDDGQSR